MHHVLSQIIHREYLQRYSFASSVEALFIVDTGPGSDANGFIIHLFVPNHPNYRVGEPASCDKPGKIRSQVDLAWILTMTPYFLRTRPLPRVNSAEKGLQRSFENIRVYFFRDICFVFFYTFYCKFMLLYLHSTSLTWST